MGTFFYYLMTFAEATLGVVGIRGLYEQPHYTVVERLPGSIEIRDYPARVAAESDDTEGGQVAFPRLFRYITGNNTSGEKIAMTAPVSQRGEMIAMTVPVQTRGQGGVMRFFPSRLIRTSASSRSRPNGSPRCASPDGSTARVSKPTTECCWKDCARQASRPSAHRSC